MQTDVEKVSPTEVEIRVQIPWERVEKDLNDSFRMLGKQARVKGFRPGKVPPKVIRRMFGARVRGEVTAELIQRSLIEAVTSHELPVVSQPEVDTPEIAEGKPLAFVAKLQVRPSIGHIDLSKVVVPKADQEVPNSAIDAAVERLRFEHAELRSIEAPRPAAAGDILTVDYSVAIDGEAKPDMGTEGRTIELGNDSLLGSFEEGLVGASLNETKEISLPFEEDDPRKELAGKTAVFQVTVKSIQERILPELDDEFARDVGDFASLLELRLDLRKRLEAEASRRAEETERDRLLDKLLEAEEVPVPSAMVEEEKRDMLMSLAKIAQGSGLGAEFMQSMTADLDSRATRKVQVGLLLGAIAKDANLEVVDAEVDAKLAELAEATGKHIAKVRADHAGERGQMLRSQLLEEKLFAHLRSKVTWSDPEVQQEGGGSENKPAQAGEEAAAEAQSAGKNASSATKKATSKKAKAPSKRKRSPKSTATPSGQDGSGE